MTIEKALARLEEINRALSLGETTVNEAVELYKEAAALLAECDKMIKEAREELERARLSAGESE